MATFAEYSRKKKRQSAAGLSFEEYTTTLLGEDALNRNASNRIVIDKVETKKKKEEDTWFKSGAFGDGKGNFFTDALATVGSTLGDVGVGLAKGVTGLGEGVVDLGMYGVAGAADLLGADNFAKGVKKTAQKSFTNNFYKSAENVVDKYSVLGNKSDAVTQGLGQVGGILLTGGLGAAGGLGTVGVTALTTGLNFASSAGSGMSEAYQSGASDKEALIYGSIKGGIDAGTEMLFGGLGKGVKAIGISKGVGGFDDMFADYATKKITNQIVKNTAKYGIKAAGEGLEEVLAGVGTAFAKEATYKSEEELSSLLEDENLLDQFITGALVGGIASTPSLVKANASGRDYTSGLTANEQKVVDAEVKRRIKAQETDDKKLTKKEQSKIIEEVQKELKSGSIDTDIIEKTLISDNETYKNYKSITEQETSLKKKIDDIKNDTTLTATQKDTLTKAINSEIEALNKTEVQGKLMSEIDTLTEKDTYLRESYNEKGRRTQKFEADLSKYDEKQKEVIQRAIDSGILNNTNRTHEFVDFLAKVSSDKGVLFDFTNNEKIKEDGLAIEGSTVNGYVKDGTIAVNIQSNKALNTVVGHEVTHTLEGTEQYTELQNMIIEYAKTKGDYQARYDELSKLYEGVENANIENELTADLVGDYLFTDSKFIEELSVTKPNIFKRIYQEIKHLLKLATGSKEARQLEQVKRAFDKAYKQSNATTDSETRYSLEKTSDGTEYVKAESGIFVKKDGTLASEREVFNALEGKTIHLADGDVKIVKNLPKKEMYNELFKRQPKTLKGVEGVKELNKNVNYHMEELLTNSTMKTDNVPDINGRHKEQNLTAFDTRTVKFYDGSKVYDVELSIGILENGEKVAYAKKFFGYDEETTKKIQTTETRGSSNTPMDQQSVNNSVPQNAKMSISDNKGRTLTKEQQDFLKDSKILDADGNIKTMYHGSTAEFNVFDIKKAKSSGYYGRGFYFSDSDSHAGQYGSTYEVYLNITNPVQAGTRNITKEQLRKFVAEVAENEDYGIENYGYDATVDSVTESVYGKDDFGMLLDINATAIGDMAEAVKLFNEVNGTNYDGIIADTETVAFYPNQIKRVDNVAPTSSEDIRFSLSKTVEENKNLMAIHNLHSNELLKQLELGGIPYPSIAITKPETISHDNFGAVTLILNKDSIDPKKSAYNKVYSADAYTPTFPHIAYKADEKAAENISERVNKHFKDLPDYYQRSIASLRDDTNITDELNRRGGMEGLVEDYKNNYGMKELYLAEQGELVPLEIKRTETEMTDYQKDTGRYIIEKLGADVVEAYNAKNGFLSPMDAKKQWFEQYGEQFADAYADLLAGDLNISKEEARAIVDGEKQIWRMTEMRKVAEFLKTGGKTVKEETDYNATEAIIDSKIDEAAYERWLNDFFDGVEGAKGLRNDKDIFLPSGRRRSFEQLHEPVTLDNIVKIMRKDPVQSGQGAFGMGNIQGASTKQYNSIAEIKKNADRLGVMDAEEHEKVTQYIQDTFADIGNRYANGKDYFDAKATLAEAVAKNETKAGIAKYLKQYDYVYRYDESIVDDIIKLRDYIRSLPTPYFEAKPRRALSFDEVAAFVIPYDADANLKQELLNRGYSIAEYDPNVEGDRQRVLNQFEEFKFSLSNQNQDIAPVGSYNVYGRDIALKTTEPAIVEDIAPVREVAELPTPLTEEMANERDAQQQNIDTLNDAPEEIEAPYYSKDEDIKLEDPFDERDIKDVGKRNVKAYMYENPEVKPYFQQEAQAMLWELKNSIKGEKHFNDQLYYDTNGELGWFGTTRETSDDIAYLLDNFKYTYADIEKGLKAIIEDHGAENNAISKRIEFALNDRLKDGYTDFMSGEDVPANQDYVNLLMDKQIYTYSDEAYYEWLQSLATEEAPPLAPLEPSTDARDELAPVREDIVTPDGTQRVMDFENNQIVDEFESDTKEQENKLYHKSRKELKQALIKDRENFLIDAMDEAKNVPTLLLNNTDTIRATELVFGRENAKVINKEIFQKAIDNEAKSIAWQNKERADIKKLGIKPKSKESAAVQKYGEKQYENAEGKMVEYGDVELATEFPDTATQKKIKRAAQVMRNKYDSYIDEANAVLTELGFNPIKKRKDYMRHFEALTDAFSRMGIPFNIQQMKEYDLPTDINGLTDTFVPQKNFFANIMERKGNKTTLDAVTGIDGYIGGISNLIHHTEDIQRGRAFEDLIRDNYGRKEADKVLSGIVDETAKQKRKQQIADNHLSSYASWVHDWTDNLAGKKDIADRGAERRVGRRIFTVLDTIRKQVGANMIGFNVASSLTNLIAPVQALAKTDKIAFTKGTIDTFKSIFKKDSFMENNSFLTSRMGTDKLSKTWWEKTQDAGFIFMRGMDYFTSNLIVRSKYNELISKGASEEVAHKEAGQFAARIMGDRTKGANAQLYNSKLFNMVAQFQLEVNNQLYSMFYDTYHESKEKAEGNAARTASGMTFTLGQLFIATHIFGQAFEEIAGYNPTFDLIDIIKTALGLDDEEEEKPLDERLEEASLKLLKALPYSSLFVDGGRIPMGDALPITQFIKGEDEYGNEKPRGETFMEALPYYLLPAGYGQMKKTEKGLNMFDESLPVTGSYTDSGNLRFPVEDTATNRLQAAIFGQWANENARNYFDNERQPLKEKQIQEYADLDIPIQEYWEYREGLKEQKTVEDKFDYIAGLDLPVSKKNILINNVVDREEKVNLINYDDFSGYEEFDFATKNPEKYEFFKSNNISYADYSASEESKEAYSWAYNNPEKYVVSRAVGDVVKYKQYTSELNKLTADKDENGKSISGSRKEKVLSYINNMDADYGAKIVLYKSEYPSDNTYNNDIIEYLNNRNDITYEDMATILIELGFTVEADGTVRWD